MHLSNGSDPYIQSHWLVLFFNMFEGSHTDHDCSVMCKTTVNQPVIQSKPQTEALHPKQRISSNDH